MVSILLSTFNGERPLPLTLASIAQQTYRQWELMAVDDASTDQTHAVLEQFRHDHPGRVTVLTNEANLGLTRSLIRAAAESHGELLARIDAGDTFDPQKLERQVRFMDEHPSCGLVGCNYENRILPTDRRIVSDLPLTDAAIRRRILWGNPFAHSCILIRRSVYAQAGGYDPCVRYAQDYDLWFRVLWITQAANLRDCLCTRPMDVGSISYAKQRDQMRSCLRIRWRYMQRANPVHYLALLEPLLMLSLPTALKRAVRARP